MEESAMKSLFEELGGTYTLGKDGMYYPNLMIDDNDQRPIGKWGRMHRTYLEEVHPGLYERLILNGSLYRHLADANERAEAMMKLLTKQMKDREGITERLKAEQPMVWVGRMNSIRSRAEEIVMEEVINTL
ncbi:MAG: TnpV protein [Clostridia bacterium]|nr:TnpV protein [Clostridia bacterium]